MKKLLVPVLAATTAFAFADVDPEAVPTAVESTATVEAPAPELEKESCWTDRISGFGNYGIYSGYQLYGSLLNSQPTLQGYVEVNAALSWDGTDLGSLGIGVWSNTDLTDKRRDSYGKAFNEWDPNIHWSTTFWFDDDRTVGLFYRTSLVWYYYPHRRHDHMWGSTKTTMDWIHSFALVNPFVTPFFDWVHEYHENNADLLQFGLKKDISVDAVEGLKFTPAVTFVYRDHRYNWCFPTANFTEFHNGGVATVKVGLDANYQISEHFGLFAKVAYCSIIDSDLRNASDNTHGAGYGKYKDFAWGGVGVTFNF